MTLFTAPRRDVHFVQVHCSASDRPEHDDVAVMRRWHLARGWADVGYHYFIRKDGTVEAGRDLEAVPSGIKGHNTGAIAVCLHGLAVERFTPAQFDALRGLSDQMNAAYADVGGLRYVGHRELAAKDCPVFDYQAVLGLDEEGFRTGSWSNPAVGAPADAGDGPGWRTLEITRRGADVAWLQRVLDITADGLFGQQTNAAVVAFQKSLGIEPDGIVGPKTWAEILECAEDLGIERVA